MVSFESDLIFNLKVGYLYKLDSTHSGKAPYAVWGTFKKALFTGSGLNADFNIGTLRLWRIYDKWNCLSSSSVVISQATNANADLISWGIQLEAAPGYYTDRWAFALQLGWAFKPGLLVKPNAYSREAFKERYESASGPGIGWFYQPYHQLKAGGSVCYTHKSWQGNIQTGTYYFPSSQKIYFFPDVGLLPFYVELQLAKGF